jgi:Rad3-related DNA helicase
MSKNHKITVGIGFVAVAAIVIAFYFYFQSQNEKKKRIKTEEDNLKLILDSIHQNHDLTNEVQTQLEQLAKKFRTINPKISNEIAQALQLIQIGQVENAIEDLAKIIENLLKEHYHEDNNFKTWLGKKKADFQSRLEFCKHEKKINKVEFSFFVAVKTIRNEEDHELDVNLPNYLNASGLIIGIGGIHKLSSLVYPNLLESTN